MNIRENPYLRDRGNILFAKKEGAFNDVELKLSPKPGENFVTLKVRWRNYWISDKGCSAAQSRAWWHNEGEKLSHTKYFINLDKLQSRQGTISRLKKIENDFTAIDKEIPLNASYSCRIFVLRWKLLDSSAKWLIFLRERHRFKQRRTWFH